MQIYNEITTAEIKERKEDIKQGVWFGTGEFDSKAPMDGNYGALPYDTYIIEEYFKDVDCNLSSLYMYFKGNKLYAGPIWDFDLSMGLSADKEYNNNSNTSYEGLYCNKNIYGELLENKEFKNKVIKRYNELQKEIKKLYTDDNNTKSEITKNYKMYKDSLLKNNCKWKKDIACTLEDYKQRLEYVRKWLKNRNEWLLKEYNEKS